MSWYAHHCSGSAPESLLQCCDGRGQLRLHPISAGAWWRPRQLHLRARPGRGEWISWSTGQLNQDMQQARCVHVDSSATGQHRRCQLAMPVTGTASAVRSWMHVGRERFVQHCMLRRHTQVQAHRCRHVGCRQAPQAPCHLTSWPCAVRMHSTGTAMLYAASHSGLLRMSLTCRCA